MGDMKTPDFDDLLAAFDIPDIDAKEAIQSARDEAEGHHGPGSGTLGKPGDDGADGGHTLRPTSPPGTDPHGDPSIVSVIVKNRVRTETLEGGEGTVPERESADGTPGIGLVPRLGTRSPGLVPPESLNHNGFGSSSASGHLSQSQGQSNGDPWPLCAPKAAPDSAEFLSGSASSSKQGGGNIFNKLKPLMTQSTGDPVGRARKMQLLQQQKHLHMQQQQQQQQEAAALEANLDTKPPRAPAAAAAVAAAAAAAAAAGNSGALASSPFFPPSKAMHLPSSAASSSSSSSSSSSHTSNPRMSGPLGSSVPLQSFNGTSRSGPAGFRRLDSDEDDSDPDLGAPLVIQESPTSPACTTPKLARRVRSPAGSFESPSLPSAGSSSSFPKPGDVPSASPASPQGQQNWLSSPSSSQTSATSKSSPQEERHPEHVVEERDSPESPEPEAPKAAPSASASASASAAAAASSVSKRSASPAAATTATKTPSPALREPKEEEEEMEVAKGVAEKTEEKKEQEPKAAQEEKMDVQEEGEKEEGKTQSAEGGVAPPVAVGTATPAGGSAPSRPLKVRIKTIKTPTGSITRTVVASKGAGAGKGLEVIKAQQGNSVPASRARTRTNAAVARVAKSSASLPVSTLEASSAMLAAATKVQNKMASPSDKSKVTATAVSITKTAALTATSVVSGISVRPVTKTTNGGTLVAGGGVTVHQPNKPASIVNSTGAVISRSQSSLVEAFNKILNSKNLLPSYKPDLSTLPPPEWGLGMPTAGYRCLECGDSFALERSLVRHYDRRSLRIEVTCNHCAKRLAFFNKCSLLLHAREHKERGLVMQCSHLVMRPVTMEQMISQQDTAPIGMLSPSPSVSSTAAAPQGAPSASTAPSTSSPQKDAPVPSATSSPQPSAPRRLPNSPQAIMPLPCKKVDVLQYNNFKCPECQAQFGGKAELVAHFQQIRATPNSTCMLCSPPMMLPNWCSVSAHQRIHKHRAPHVCPECGGVARQASFQTHLEESCLHFARRIGYRCSICQVVFGGLNSIKSHIQTAHCEVFHKCPNCPMAFKSAPSAQSHISTQHPTLTATQPKMIYKCVMCDTVFTQKPLLYVHFDTHLAKQKVHVFKCPDCTKLYAQKASMMEHMKTVHRGLSAKPETPPTTTSTTPGATLLTTMQPIPKARGQEGEEWSGEPGEEEGDGQGEGGENEEEEEEEEDEENEEEEEAVSSPESSSMEWKCRECRTRYPEKEDYISHMRKEHGKPMKKFPCRQCERSFSSANSLRRHVRVIHEGIRRVFHCQYCSEGKRTFSSRLILEKHIRVRHGIRSRQPVDRQGPPNTRKRAAPLEGVGSSSEQEGDGAFEEGMEGAGGGGGGVVKRWRPVATGDISTPQQQDRDEPRQDGEETRGGGSGEGEESSTATAVAATAGYKCTPCGFTTEDWAEFQQHIPQHQAEGGLGGVGASLQCTQCGACFASAGSLARHRFITHRLRNEPRGQGANAAGAASSSPDNGAGAAMTPDGSPTSPLRGEDGSYGCRVCGRRFDKQGDLNTHFRTHGMAFITAHKNDKPT